MWGVFKDAQALRVKAANAIQVSQVSDSGGKVFPFP